MQADDPVLARVWSMRKASLSRNQQDERATLRLRCLTGNGTGDQMFLFIYLKTRDTNARNIKIQKNKILKTNAY